MRTIKGVVLGLATTAMTLMACTQDGEPDNAPSVELDDTLDPQGKTTRAPTPTMTCVQATNGCTPVGYRSANCQLAGFKANTTIVTCVKARCPAVYGYDNGRGESCFTPQKVALDGTAIAFFPLVPDASYSITTYVSKNGVPGDALASTSVTLASNVGEATQCGGVPSGSCL